MDMKDLGRGAASPPELPLQGWRRILLRVWQHMSDDNLNLVAAGIAMFGLLAIVPATVALVSVYGLFAEPGDVAAQLESLRGMMPEDARQTLADQMDSIMNREDEVQGFGIVFGVLLSLWSARRGMAAIMKGLNLAYLEKESRGFLRQTLLSLLFTGSAILASAVVILLAVIAPLLLEALPGEGLIKPVLEVGRWVVLWMLAVAGISLLYRLAPARDWPKWKWLATGSTLAATLWLIGSMGFAFYVGEFGSYGKTYGAMGGVVVLLLWFQLSAFLMLLGARLNAEMEHQTRVDTTIGPARPMGERGAVVADTLPGDVKDKHAQLENEVRSRAGK